MFENEIFFCDLNGEAVSNYPTRFHEVCIIYTTYF